jgi:hypothetical protein
MLLPEAEGIDPDRQLSPEECNSRVGSTTFKVPTKSL